MITSAYFANWSIYKTPPPEITANVDTVYYAFLLPKSNGGLEFLDLWADEEKPIGGSKGLVGYFQQLKRQNPQLKVCFAVGGWGVSFSTTMGLNVVEFASNCVDMVVRHGFDGIDIDWEYPTAAEMPLFLLLLTHLRAKMPDNYLLSIATPAGDQKFHYPIAQIDQIIDRWNIMTYDFNGSWSETIGYHSNLYGSFSVDSTIQWYIKQGASRKKIMMGIPLYGRRFKGGTRIGDKFISEEPIDYKELDISKRKYDRINGSAYIELENDFIAFDSEESVDEKKRYAEKNGLGGMFVWEMGGDKGMIKRMR